MVTIQNAVSPYTTQCLTCGAEWLPEPTRSGPNRGQHTDNSLQKAAETHTCEPK